MIFSFEIRTAKVGWGREFTKKERKYWGKGVGGRGKGVGNRG
jgi:hypothetical protein